MKAGFFERRNVLISVRYLAGHPRTDGVGFSSMSLCEGNRQPFQKAVDQKASVVVMFDRYEHLSGQEKQQIKIID